MIFIIGGHESRVTGYDPHRHEVPSAGATNQRLVQQLRASLGSQDITDV